MKALYPLHLKMRDFNTQIASSWEVLIEKKRRNSFFYFQLFRLKNVLKYAARCVLKIASSGVMSIYLGLFSFILMTPLWADTPLEPLLNQVSLQFSAEQWVTTKTALVTVGVNASVSDSGLEKIQSEVLSKLNQISNKAEWHIVSFNRNQDQSGLERVQISAQVRLASADLNGLRDKAKAISKPGETFTIDNVEFSPSSDELRAATTTLRNDIYQQIKTEIDDLNKLYPESKYYLHNVNFLGEVMPQPMAMYKTNTLVASAADVRSTSNLAVGDKLKMTATVVLATAPNAEVIKMIGQKNN
jgi:predicted secreted protein